MRKRNPKAVKAKEFLEEQPHITPIELSNMFKIPYQTAYNIVRLNKIKQLETTVDEEIEIELPKLMELTHAVSKGKQRTKEKTISDVVNKTVREFGRDSMHENDLFAVVDSRVDAEINKQSLTNVRGVIQGVSGAKYEAMNFDPVNSPAHYTIGGIETIDFIEAKELNYHLGNAVKYIVRAEHKGKKKEDLEKAIWYLNRELNKAV